MSRRGRRSWVPKSWARESGSSAIQENKPVGHGLKKARRMLDRCGWGACFEPALVTPKLGKSSGVAVLWDRKMVGTSDVAGGPVFEGGEH